MRAIILRELGGPERLVLEEVDDPRPGPGEAVVALRAAALNHRDAWITKGLYAGIKLPIILGSDGAGEVAAVGDGVDRSWLAVTLSSIPASTGAAMPVSRVRRTGSSGCRQRHVRGAREGPR